MISSISITNFRSFKDRTTISFAANKSNLLTDHIDSDPLERGHKLTKYNIIFGPNSSGKSNLIEAISFMRWVVKRSMPNYGVDGLPYMFSSDGVSQVATFEMSFYVDGLEHAFSYLVSVNYESGSLVQECLSYGNKVYYEWHVDEDGFVSFDQLRKLKSGVDRKKMDSYVDEYCTESYPEHTFLQFCLSNRKNDVSSEIAQILEPAYQFFSDIFIVSPNPMFYDNLEDLCSQEKAVNFPTFKKLLKSFDLGIESIQFTEVTEDKFFFEARLDEKEASRFKRQVKRSITPGSRAFIKTDNGQHYFKLTEDGKIQYFQITVFYTDGHSIPFSSESTGTQKLINLLTLLEDKSIKVIFIDEIDRSFHTWLSMTLIKEIQREFKTRKGQVIMSAHDVNLMDAKLFRKDELFLMEKENHVTKIRRIDEYNLRVDRDIKTKYLKRALQ